MIDELVAEHLELHGGNVEESLATLSSIGEAKSELDRLGDIDLNRSLAQVGFVRRSFVPKAEETVYFSTNERVADDPSAIG